MISADGGINSKYRFEPAKTTHTTLHLFARYLFEWWLSRIVQMGQKYRVPSPTGCGIVALMAITLLLSAKPAMAQSFLEENDPLDAGALLSTDVQETQLTVVHSFQGNTGCGMPVSQPRDNNAALQIGFELSDQTVCYATAGKRLTIPILLRSEDGKPVRRRAIKFVVNGWEMRRARTDEQGVATFTTLPDWTAGTYRLEASYKGSSSLRPSKVAVEIIVNPIQVKIQVIPPLDGILFKLNEVEFESDERGLAQITVDKGGTYALELLTEFEDRGNYRLEFERWRAEHFELQRTVKLPYKSPFQVGFGISYRVDQKFVDTDGNPVDEERITSFSYLSSHGALIERTDKEAHWLDANRVTRRRHGLEAVPVQYSLMSVIVDGANVVNRKQQRFFAEKPDDLWQFTLIFYAARFSAQDALFGFPLGDGIRLEYPDGSIVHHPSDENGSVVLESLARGAYKVQVSGASGMAPLTPVAITRFQDVPLRVISYLDMGLAIGIALAGAIGLFLAGRPHLITVNIWRRKLPMGPLLETEGA